MKDFVVAGAIEKSVVLSGISSCRFGHDMEELRLKLLLV
jgi:hypothetical protein